MTIEMATAAAATIESQMKYTPGRAVVKQAVEREHDLQNVIELEKKVFIDRVLVLLEELELPEYNRLLTHECTPRC